MKNTPEKLQKEQSLSPVSFLRETAKTAEKLFSQQIKTIKKAVQLAAIACISLNTPACTFNGDLDQYAQEDISLDRKTYTKRRRAILDLITHSKIRKNSKFKISKDINFARLQRNQIERIMTNLKPLMRFSEDNFNKTNRLFSLLKEKYGIINFDRYPLELLQKIENDGYLKERPNDNRPVVICFLAMKDHPIAGIWALNVDTKNLLKLKKYRLLVMETDSMDQIQIHLKRMISESEKHGVLKKGNKANVAGIIFGGHGNKGSQQTGLKLENIHQLSGFNPYLKPDAIVAFSSCYSAQDGDDPNNICSRASVHINAQCIGSTQLEYGADLDLSENGYVDKDSINLESARAKLLGVNDTHYSDKQKAYFRLLTQYRKKLANRRLHKRKNNITIDFIRDIILLGDEKTSGYSLDNLTLEYYSYKTTGVLYPEEFSDVDYLKSLAPDKIRQFFALGYKSDSFLLAKDNQDIPIEQQIPFLRLGVTPFFMRLILKEEKPSPPEMSPEVQKLLETLNGKKPNHLKSTPNSKRLSLAKKEKKYSLSDLKEIAEFMSIRTIEKRLYSNQNLKSFASVYGPFSVSTMKKWYKAGIKTPEDLKQYLTKEHKNPRFTQKGLKPYLDAGIPKFTAKILCSLEIKPETYSKLKKQGFRFTSVHQWNEFNWPDNTDIPYSAQQLKKLGVDIENAEMVRFFDLEKYDHPLTETIVKEYQSIGIDSCYIMQRVHSVGLDAKKITAYRKAGIHPHNFYDMRLLNSCGIDAETFSKNQGDLKNVGKWITEYLGLVK